MAGATTAPDAPSLPYHEPGIVTILILTSFLLLLNAVNSVLDKLLYCGLLGQIFIGIAWGAPGVKWLSSSTEDTIVQLGYLGLILLVFEGGLHTSFQSLKANLALSSCVALTGIAVPIGLSYSLQGLLHASALQAFAAGAALCSTSLGTTFTVLAASGLSASRLGVVLTSAAMMDDVVGLVMVQVISNLGDTNFSWVTVVRPILVSIAFAVVVPLICVFVVKPLTVKLNAYRQANSSLGLNRLLYESRTAFVTHTLLLVGLVSAATYAGTSNLFAAYIAGATISWWDSEVPHPVAEPTDPRIHHSGGHLAGIGGIAVRESPGDNSTTAGVVKDTSGSFVYEEYYLPAVSKILQPFFFASIGFSIPITRMFSGAILWRGMVYTLLMALAKILCGFWLVRFSSQSTSSNATRRSRLMAIVNKLSIPHLWGKKRIDSRAAQTRAVELIARSTSEPTAAQRNSSTKPAKPFSLHPPLILALAMCARGEIGFLISGVAEARGIFAKSTTASEGPSDIYLVVTWAIVLCTVIGPLGVGLSVRRVKKLEQRKNRHQAGSGRDVLGVWGVD